jgi:CubicO group peptidase (beta-lactamase class C family)
MKIESTEPEKLGLPSQVILNFLEHLEERKLCMHSIMLLRHDKIAVEAHYPPFMADTLHRMYSVTKSFVSIAIGFMIDEGKLQLQSKMCDYFPEYSETIHPFTAEMRVRDLLLMATPYNQTTYTVQDNDWVKTFFTAQATHKGGSVFNYDTSGTVALSALVEKLSGQNLVDYLRPRLFEPLGFTQDVWCIERPEGGSWGGSGLVCRVHDLACFGLFLLHRGNWLGKQLLSASYLAEACSPLIDNRVSVSDTEMQFGYGYQIWQTRHRGFCAYGMGSQLVLCLPEKDVILVTTGDTQSIPHGHDIILDTFWKDVYPHIEDTKLSENKAGLRKLKIKLDNLEFPLVDGEKFSAWQSSIKRKEYLFQDNAMKISWAFFDFADDEGTMKYANASGAHEIHFGLGKYIEGIFPEKSYFGKKIGKPRGRGYRYKASGAWFNPHSLTIYLYIIDDFLGTLKINSFFDEDTLTLQMNKNAEWFLDEYIGMASGRISG